MLKRRSLLIEYGRFAGGGSNASSPAGVSGYIPNVATSRFSTFPHLNPWKERDRRKGELRRRERLRELVREWLSPPTGGERKKEARRRDGDQPR